MSAIHTLLFALSITASLATSAEAQVPATPVQPSAPASGQDLGQPVSDRTILIHGILDQFEGRTDGRTPDIRWSGEGWIGTDYDKFWVKTEGFRRRDGSVDDGQHEFLYSRAISTFSTCKPGCAATSTRAGTGIGRRLASRALRRFFSR
jgi:copper resistance protein B